MGTAVGHRRSTALSACFVVLFAALVGYLFPLHPTAAVGLATLGMLAALAWNDTTRLALIAVPGVWLVSRLPGIDVSVTDVLVTTAGLAALIAGAQRSLQRPARLLFIVFLVYLASLGPSLLANHNFRSDFELFHRVGIVGGSLLAGAWLVQQGVQHLALRALFIVTVLVSIAAVLDSASNGFAPGEPFGYNKNFVGSLAATTLVTILAAGQYFRLRRPVLMSGTVAMALGLVATQSRGAMLAVALGGVIWFLRVSPSRRRKHWKLALLAVALFGTVATLSLTSQVEAQTAGSIDSLTHRLEVEAETRALWQENPVAGVGLRFFATPQFAGYEPPNNVLNEILAEAGFPGLLGFITFAFGAAVALWRCSGELAVAGLCVVVARYAHGLVDIYWVGGTTTLPWIIAGMGIAAVSATAASPRREALIGHQGGPR